MKFKLSTRTQLGYISGAFCLILGVLSFINPLLMVRLLGLEVVEGHGISEIRAVYGALFIAMGVMMLWAVPTRPKNAGWLRLASYLWLAAAAGRLSSMLIFDGATLPMNFLILTVELVVGVFALLASFENPQLRQHQDTIPDPLKAYR